MELIWLTCLWSAEKEEKQVIRLPLPLTQIHFSAASISDSFDFARALFLLVPSFYPFSFTIASHEWETGDIRYPKVSFARLIHALWRVADDARCLGYVAVPQTSPKFITFSSISLSFVVFSKLSDFLISLSLLLCLSDTKLRERATQIHHLRASQGNILLRRLDHQQQHGQVGGIVGYRGEICSEVSFPLLANRTFVLPPSLFQLLLLLSRTSPPRRHGRLRRQGSQGGRQHQWQRLHFCCSVIERYEWRGFLKRQF